MSADPNDWKRRNRSFYYTTAPEPDDPDLNPATTALLVIDVQNTYLTRPERASLSGAALADYEAWTPFHTRMHETVIPNIATLLAEDEWPSRIVPALAPVGDEITITKTTDSALTGTNLRLILHNLGIRTVICAGIFTDQCVASTVRSLADESFDVVVIEDSCAAATLELHEAELRIINMIYCNVMNTAEVQALLPR